MAALTGNKIKDSYLGLLKSISNGVISSSFVQISDGGGNALPLYLSTSSIKFYNAYTFPSADGTVSGQVLSTDASGTLSWVTSSDNQTLEEVLTQGNTTTIAISSSADITTTAQFNGDINGALLQKVKAAEVLLKGDVVYISGGTGANPEVSKANASDSTKMPALGIMKENLNNINDEGECITSGELTGVDLTGIATGAELFVSSTTAGELVTTAPTGEANLIQKIGKVIKGDSSGGALTVLGAFRTNAVPNLNSAKIFLGNASNQAVSATISGDATISNTGVIALATVPVTKGGTGATTLTGILLGDGTSAISGITSTDDGHVLTADGNGGYAFEVSSGDVSISGTPTTNQVAIWTDGSTIKGMSALEIDTNDKITLDQDASSYNIGGGNIANVTGISNTGFGLDNLNAVTTGNRNVAFGYYSLKNLTIGTDNVAIGYAALQDVTEAIKCVAIGSEALNSVTTGHFNVAVGHTAGSYVSTSTRNTLVGYGAGNQLDTTGTPSGGYNTFIGYQSGGSVTTGTKNVIIGSNDGSVYGQSSNHIIISDGDGNVRVYFDNNGQLSLFNEFFFRDSSATGSPIMFSITQGIYTASAPYNTNILNARNNTNISFQTTGNTNALFIQGTTGNVGIGTALPDATGFGWNVLTIQGGSSGGEAGVLELKTGAANSVNENLGVIAFLNGSTRVAQIDAISEGSNNTSAINFYTHNNTSMEKRLTISSGGDVNIGSADGLPLMHGSVAGNVNYCTYSFVNDQNTGMIRTGADTLALVTAGSPKLTISSGGLTQINSTSTTALELITNQSASSLRLKNTGSIVADWIMQSGGITAGDLAFYNLDTSAYRLTISSGGNADFSEYVRVKGDTAAFTTGVGVEMAYNSTNNRGQIGVYDRGNSAYKQVYFYGSDYVFDAGGTPRLTISSGGDASFSGSVTADGGMVINGNAGLTANNYGSGKNSSFLSSHASQPQGILIHYTAASPNGTGNLFIECKDTSTQRFTVRSNGGVANYSGNNVNLASDIRLKKDIVNLPSEWDRLKQIKVVNYRYKDSDEERVLYGAIAQQVQEIYPNLVEVTVEATKTKPEYFGLREQPFQWLTTKVLQEAMTKIESQQTIIEDLKARIETLEG